MIAATIIDTSRRGNKRGLFLLVLCALNVCSAVHTSRVEAALYSLGLVMARLKRVSALTY